MKRKQPFEDHVNQINSERKKMPVYQVISSKFGAMLHCQAKENHEWEDKHCKEIEKLVKDYLPRGSGIDSGVIFNFGVSKPERLVFDSSYHCMNEWGYYDGWIDFQVILKPSLQFGFTMQIIGRFSDRHYKYSDLKDCLYEEFDCALNQKIDMWR